MSSSCLFLCCYVLIEIVLLTMGIIYAERWTACNTTADCNGYVCTSGVCQCSWHVFHVNNCNLMNPWFYGVNLWLLFFFIFLFIGACYAIYVNIHCEFKKWPGSTWPWDKRIALVFALICNLGMFICFMVVGLAQFNECTDDAGCIGGTCYTTGVCVCPPYGGLFCTNNIYGFFSFANPQNIPIFIGSVFLIIWLCIFIWAQPEITAENVISKDDDDGE